MKEKIKIDIVSDVVCPWCVIGYKRLEKAINELGVQDQIDIVWHPFELNPGLADAGKRTSKHLSDRYNMSETQIKLYQNERTKDGESLGFKFDYYDEMNIVNTRDAHILIDYAKEFSKQTEMQIRLSSAHFGERKIISNRDVLLKEVEAVGLNPDEAMKRLTVDASEKIAKEELYWQNKGVASVPTMVWNNESMMNGAYPIETYKQVIKEYLSKHN